ncbi:unnamed protein product [Mytilus coruscus]|uniref:C-type lectin domain-containing protein n=1 Tax=Mytilus coruscus TaxID=42192 RepID=A0A6J8D048_MYTCO|nr:unnamed protein product [Mytilus coruscus]
MVIPYVIVVLCFVSPSTQFNGFNIGQGLGNTQVFDDAESATVVQTGPSFPAQVSVVNDPDIGIGDGGGDGFGGLLMMGLPLLLLLAAFGGGTGLTATPAAAAISGSAAASACPVCTTPVQTTCPSTAAQCSPTAACPAGFSVVENANSNKCYFAGSVDVANFAAANAACATAGGSLFEPGSTAELTAVQTFLPTTTPAAQYYIGYTDIGSIATIPVGFNTGSGLPVNSFGANPAFTGALECVTVPKAGSYAISAQCIGPGRVLCEARLVSKTANREEKVHLTLIAFQNAYAIS